MLAAPGGAIRSSNSGFWVGRGGSERRSGGVGVGWWRGWWRRNPGQVAALAAAPVAGAMGTMGCTGSGGGSAWEGREGWIWGG